LADVLRGLMARQGADPVLVDDAHITDGMARGSHGDAAW
jgi:hypothetical protein